MLSDDLHVSWLTLSLNWFPRLWLCENQCWRCEWHTETHTGDVSALVKLNSIYCAGLKGFSSLFCCCFHISCNWKSFHRSKSFSTPSFRPVCKDCWCLAQYWVINNCSCKHALWDILIRMTCVVPWCLWKLKYGFFFYYVFLKAVSHHDMHCFCVSLYLHYMPPVCPPSSI